MYQDMYAVEEFRAETQRRIAGVLEEFSKGKLNREQFQAVYAHYHDKMEQAERALVMNDASLIPSESGMTFDLLETHMAKALGFMIYHNKSGLYVDTLGDFDIPPARIAPALNDFTEWMECNRQIEPLIERMSEKDWVHFAAGRFTTVITLFHNDPSTAQSREIARLHHDFEVANEHQLMSRRVNAAKLGYPFLVFLEESDIQH